MIFMTLIILIFIAIIIYLIFIQGSNAPFSSKNKRCPNCSNPIEDYYNVCPVCKETLKTKCSNCNEKIEAAWTYCPYCETKVNRVNEHDKKV